MSLPVCLRNQRRTPSVQKCREDEDFAVTLGVATGPAFCRPGDWTGRPEWEEVRTTGAEALQAVHDLKGDGWACGGDKCSEGQRLHRRHTGLHRPPRLPRLHQRPHAAEQDPASPPHMPHSRHKELVTTDHRNIPSLDVRAVKQHIQPHHENTSPWNTVSRLRSKWQACEEMCRSRTLRTRCRRPG